MLWELNLFLFLYHFEFFRSSYNPWPVYFWSSTVCCMLWVISRKFVPQSTYKPNHGKHSQIFHRFTFSIIAERVCHAAHERPSKTIRIYWSILVFNLFFIYQSNQIYCVRSTALIQSFNQLRTKPMMPSLYYRRFVNWEIKNMDTKNRSNFFSFKIQKNREEFWVG